jgi:mannose-6-phosphate isomerase
MAPHPESPLPTLEPFRLDPVFVPRVWGSNDLRPWYDLPAPGGPIGEVWLTGDDCLIATGPHRGLRLAELFRLAPLSLLGPSAPAGESPLLIKVIFAREKLSVQVHPDDRTARRQGHPCGKTECWYVLAAEPGAQVALGLHPGSSLLQIKEEIRAGTLESSLNLLPVSPGDMVYVEAGAVHAIWPGSILLEIQQNSDLTYRMYDYGRPRELHIDQSLQALNLFAHSGKIPSQSLPGCTLLIDSPYFRIERLHISGSRSSSTLPTPATPGQLPAAPGLAYLFAASGAARIAGPGFEPVELSAHSIAAIPAASPAFTISDLGGLDLIRVIPNWSPTKVS